MPQINKYKSFQTIAWISKNQAQISDYASYLKAKNIDVRASDSVDHWQTSKNEILPCIFLINTQESEDLTADINVIKTECNADIIGIFDSTNTDQKETFILSGGSACLTTPFGNEELWALLSHYSSSHKQSFDFKTQLEEASQMALLAMENSSDLGGVISFIKKAMISNNYAKLANNIFKATELDCETCLIEIKGQDTNQYFSACKTGNSLSENTVDKDMKQYLLSQKNSGRIVKLDNILQINQSNLVILLDGVPYKDTNKMERLSDNLVILSDVANRIAETLTTEESLQIAEKERQSFLNTLSHELRTPLNGILGFSKALKSKSADKVLGASGFEALNRIIESTEQVNAIISTLIEISSNSNNNLDERNEKIEVDKMLIRLQNDFKQAAINKGLQLETSSPDGLHLFNDSAKLYNILTRLIDNALKFTATGTISITVTTDSCPDKSQLIIFKVKDTGIGIDEKNHKKIFSEIGQLNTEHDRSHYGVGLGLYYSNLVAQQINAALSVDSILGEGAEFSLSLPLTSENIEQVSPSNHALSSNSESIDDFLF